MATCLTAFLFTGTFSVLGVEGLVLAAELLRNDPARDCAKECALLTLLSSSAWLSLELLSADLALARALSPVTDMLAVEDRMSHRT